MVTPNPNINSKHKHVLIFLGSTFFSDDTTVPMLTTARTLATAELVDRCRPLTRLRLAVTVATPCLNAGTLAAAESVDRCRRRRGGGRVGSRPRAPIQLPVEFQGSK